MRYQLALPALGLLAAAACSGRDIAAPITSSRQLTDQNSMASSSASQARNGNLSAVKACTGSFTGEPGSYCTITASSLKAIEVGSRIYYLNNPLDVFGPFGTDVKLDVPGPGNNAASGHCKMDLVTNVGLCTFSGGTGKFTWFNATLRVSDPSEGTWQLNGSYSYGK
jgi:hypothetical protein